MNFIQLIIIITTKQDLIISDYLLLKIKRRNITEIIKKSEVMIANVNL